MKEFKDAIKELYNEVEKIENDFIIDKSLFWIENIKLLKIREEIDKLEKVVSWINKDSWFWNKEIITRLFYLNDSIRETSNSVNRNYIEGGWIWFEELRIPMSKIKRMFDHKEYWILEWIESISEDMFFYDTGLLTKEDRKKYSSPYKMNIDWKETEWEHILLDNNYRTNCSYTKVEFKRKDEIINYCFDNL
jgi:hypothetical protein